MSRLQAVPTSQQPQGSNYRQLDTYFDERYQIAWGYMHSEPRPCFTPELLGELLTWCGEVAAQIDDPNRPDVHYQVTASSSPGVFNLGGDLHLFRDHILRRDRDGLYRYALACIEPLYMNAVHLNRPGLKSVSLVQGDALGGGFECALSGNVLIAERGSKMGFPEILFNLFPGMGALTLLGRRIGMARAERMILSGNLYSAEELYEQGVVDVLAEPGEGVQAVYDFVRREGRARNGTLALRAARERIQPISHEEIRQVTEIWVDAALRIEPKDLRMMERLIARQGGKLETATAGSAAEGIRLAG
ncbi:MAG: enoyl-CoA hydratase [Hydrogenophilales bacterium CG03_land_8_20_14_0_80_62_28]|nr:MAG: enoyl-CoA hydratase [Hydrogenophilaceae bacterium CG1_02_62_390]PIV23205.1 MAG: enoyl-CoA hydratase [Hydrogenophilales bacterium CG03_land_8_20_14_0_80_62_28]PIW38122.1 MAG: enoyl-CoA hydratase [Hydrogenophilales bacterium CG15_BIG_FIL_POST_REV_8_21_14_020_62_31]